jgi:hypothetical protein
MLSVYIPWQNRKTSSWVRISTEEVKKKKFPFYIISRTTMKNITL